MKNKKYHTVCTGQNLMKNKKYHTVCTGQNLIEKQKIPHCLYRSKSNRKTKNTTLSVQVKI